jgi:hypothetical protein
LPGEGSVRIRQPSQVFFSGWYEQRNQELLRSRAVGRCALSQEFLLESLGAESLSPLPASGGPYDLLMLIVNRDVNQL